VLAEASRERSPTRGEVRVRNAALLVSGVVVPVGVFLGWGGTRSAPRPASLIVETASGAAAVALTALVVAVGRGRSMLGRTGTALLAVAVLTPIVLFAWKVGVSSLYPGMMVQWPERAGFRCLWLSCQTAAWPLVAIAMTRRGTDPTHPGLTGVAIGAAVGACSWVLVDLWCPVAYVPHLLLGHLLPLLACTVAGYFLVGRVVKLGGR
jgi:hypothetical protein